MPYDFLIILSLQKCSQPYSEEERQTLHHLKENFTDISMHGLNVVFIIYHLLTCDDWQYFKGSDLWKSFDVLMWILLL